MSERKGAGLSLTKMLVLAATCIVAGILLGRLSTRAPPAPAGDSPVLTVEQLAQAVDAKAALSSTPAPSAASPSAPSSGRGGALPGEARLAAADRSFPDGADWIEQLERDEEESAGRDAAGPEEIFEEYQRFGDGPVEVIRPEDAEASSTKESNDAAAECLPPRARGCRTDDDCCGASLCRSRPGTISGFWECTD